MKRLELIRFFSDCLLSGLVFFFFFSFLNCWTRQVVLLSDSTLNRHGRAEHLKCVYVFRRQTQLL